MELSLECGAHGRFKHAKGPTVFCFFVLRRFRTRFFFIVVRAGAALTTEEQLKEGCTHVDV
eukprot:6429808-Karenia_brevis.AAC.1